MTRSAPGMMAQQVNLPGKFISAIHDNNNSNSNTDGNANEWVHKKDLITALARAQAKVAAAVRIAPPATASPASLAAAASSVLAGIGKEVLACGTFPGGIGGATEAEPAPGGGPAQVECSVSQASGFTP
jgi:hypothetical protein